jgi:uncharacterized protein (TIGR02145 family)
MATPSDASKINPMKKVLIILTLVCYGAIHAQPQKINYQAVAVNSSGVTVKNRVISLRLSILDSSSTGSVLFSETHQPTTDGSGQFNVFLGGGTAVSGTFSNIPWGNTKDKFLKAEADLNGGANYVLMGVSQVVSVPYALQASSLKEGATITGANGSQYTLTVGANGPVWSLTNPNVNFSCGQSVSYAGESYPTVQIGTQCWFQKNLNVGTMILGANDQTNNSTLEKYCYDNDPANCAIYGGLYQWAEAVQYQYGASNTTSPIPVFSGKVKGMCPPGWHIPSDNDYCLLNTLIDQSVNCNIFGLSGSNIGGKLQSPAYWHLNYNANNSSGFSALPSGLSAPASAGWAGLPNGGFTNQTFTSTFWSNSTNISSNAYSFNLAYNSNQVSKNNDSKSYGFSVRCLKD